MAQEEVYRKESGNGERFFVEERTDAWGNPEYLIVEHGRFEEANWEWRMVPRASRVVAVFTDEWDARMDLLQWRNV